MQSRDKFIDFLRFIGLALIIFAHVEPPYALFQLRNFDVPLMVLVSALSFGISYRPETSLFQYVTTRFLRLVVPVWIFLTVYFSAVFFLDSASEDLTKSTIFRSYALLDGIGYVWIIRVFLLVALIAPFLMSLNLKIENNPKYFGILGVALIAYEASVIVTKEMELGKLFEYVSYIVYYMVPYGILFAYGLRMQTLGKKTHIFIIVVSALLFTIIAVYLYIQNGKIIPTQDFKYPPQIYYLSFALIGCEFVWVFGRHIWEMLGKINYVQSVILFIAQNSLWIYLWHIPFIKYLDMNFIPKYGIVLACATVIAFIQVQIVMKWIIPAIRSQALKKKVRNSLTG